MRALGLVHRNRRDTIGDVVADGLEGHLHPHPNRRRRLALWPRPKSRSLTTPPRAATSSSANEHEALRESIHKFVVKEPAPHAEKWEETTFPDSVFARMGELGFLGLSMPEELRRAGGDYYGEPGAGRGARHDIPLHWLKSLPRTEDLRPVRGLGRYTADLAPGNSLRLFMVRSPTARPDRQSIDKSVRRRPCPACIWC